VGYVIVSPQLSIVNHRPRLLLRNALFSVIGHLPCVRHQIALHMAGLAKHRDTGTLNTAPPQSLRRRRRAYAIFGGFPGEK
jgi:hypothetical protein